MIYYDAYLPGVWSKLTGEDFVPDMPNGVQLEGPGQLSVIVYAACQRGAFMHVLVTPEQLTQIETDNIPCIFFEHLPPLDKGPLGGPAAVFLLRGVLQPNGAPEALPGSTIRFLPESGDPIYEGPE
jgi:hypothetical protein